jgi:hypothetical protein
LLENGFVGLFKSKQDKEQELHATIHAAGNTFLQYILKVTQEEPFGRSELVSIIPSYAAAVTRPVHSQESKSIYSKFVIHGGLIPKDLEGVFTQAFALEGNEVLYSELSPSDVNNLKKISSQLYELFSKAEREKTVDKMQGEAFSQALPLFTHYVYEGANLVKGPKKVHDCLVLALSLSFSALVKDVNGGFGFRDPIPKGLRVTNAIVLFSMIPILFAKSEINKA